MPNQEEEILKELGRLIGKVEQFEKRLEVIEKQQAPQPAEPIPYREIPEHPPEIEEKIIPPPEKKPIDIEEAMGTWLPRIGMLALLFGVGFFLKYAFDHQWIGPTGRIILGLLGGISLLGAGEYFESKKYHSYARVFTGGGLAILYFSLYAARNLYQMIGVTPTFISMLFVTLAAGFFAVRYNSQIVAFYSIIGGFVTPFLIGAAGVDRIGLLWYMAILNLGIFGLAFFKKWRILNFVAFAFTAIIYLATYERFHSVEPLSSSLGFLTFYFLIFAFAAFLYNIIYRFPALKEDIYLILGNAFYYYGFSYFLLKPDYENLLGLFTFGLAIFYLILAYLAFSRNPQDKFLPLVLLGTCVAFVTTGIWVQFEQYWITIFWTLEALVLLWVGFQIKDFAERAYSTRILALAIFILALLRLMFIDSRIPLGEFTPIFNERVFVFLPYIISLFLAAMLYSYYKEMISEPERKISTACIMVANFLIIYLLSVEIIDYFGLKIKELSSGKDVYVPSRYSYEEKRTLLYQRNACLSISWAFYSIILIAIGIIKRYKPIRLMALILFGITTLKVFFMDLSYLQGFPRILSFIVLGLLLLGAGFLYNKYKDKIQEFI
jgi:uncharacterized membrane protein